MKDNQPLLLTDEQMRKFIAEGFLILKTDFPESFHQALTEKLDEVYEKEGNPGNNLLPRIRELQKVFEHPVVTGALTSVLGENYMLHAHRHGHYNASPKAGGWHKDSYWGYKRLRNHHPWWAMVMYFPQDTPVELGPTGILPGTQNYETRTFTDENPEGEALASGKAGTFALIHYDIWHRSTPNVLGKSRFMLKFEFMRTRTPESPSWDNRDSEWRAPDSFSTPIVRHDTMWEETWNWLSGRPHSLSGTAAAADEAAVSALAADLESASEPIALNGAYELARCGDVGIAALMQALRHPEKRVSRLAAYGLSVSGAGAVDGLTEALADESDDVVRHAVFALGELRELAAGAAPALQALLETRGPKVRHAVVDALGLIGPAAPAAATAGLIRCLQDEDVQMRFMAGLSLSRLGAAAAEAVPALEAVLDDDNRYVRAHALEALRYIGTEQAKDVLIRSLFQARWCPTTTPANTFYP